MDHKIDLLSRTAADTLLVTTCTDENAGGDFEEVVADYAEIAKGYGATGIRIGSADELLPALREALESDRPVVIDVPMINNPTPTTGHWNILS